MNKKLPISIPLEDDELLFSWVNRLYKANLFDSKKEFEKAFNKGQSIYRDGFGLCRDLILASAYENQLRDVFLKSTLYPFFAPFYNKQKQEKVLSVARCGVTKDSPLSYLGCEVGTLKYCPKCVEEDSKLYLHRAHQLPGVKVCHKHGCRLVELDKAYNDNDIENIQFDWEPSFKHTDEEMKHAVFVKDFMNEAFDLDFNGLIAILKIRLKELNINTEEDAINFFSEREINLKDLAAKLLVSSPHLLSKVFLEENLYLFFNSIKDFRRLYKEILDIEFSPHSFSDNNYELIGPYKKNLLEVKHKGCGKSFLITEHGLLEIGFRCPDCTKLSNEEAYDKMFKSIAGSDYTLLTPYVRPKSKVKVMHSCGHEFEVAPNDFYFNGRGCPKCRVRLSKEAAQYKVNLVDPSYELIDYTTSDSTATFLHKTCGHTIKRRFTDFLRKNMSCPYCSEKRQKRKTPIFKNWLKDLVGDEYELVGDYMGDRRPVKIRHNNCGLVTEYPRAAYFLKGQRCPLCHGAVSQDDIRAYVSARSNGAYTVMRFLPSNDLEILNVITDDVYTLKKKLVLQELARPTMSEFLPCHANENIKRPISVGGKFFRQIQNLYNGKSFRIKDLTELGWSYSQASKQIKRLICLGLVKKEHGAYRLVQNYKKDLTD